jgi:hypothetical protein
MRNYLGRRTHSDPEEALVILNFMLLKQSDQLLLEGSLLVMNLLVANVLNQPSLIRLTYTESLSVLKISDESILMSSISLRLQSQQ